MKKLLTIIITLILFNTSYSYAKTYYFKSLNGIVESSNSSSPFSTEEGGDTVDLDVSLAFSNSSLYVTPDSSGSISYSLSGSDAGSVTLSLSSNNESFLSASDITIDTGTYTINIPSSATSEIGTVNLTLLAKDSGGNTVATDNLYVNITPLSADNMLTKWTVSAGETIQFPFSDDKFTNTYSGHIDWGDGSDVESFTDVTIQTLSHTYTDAGTYDIRIDGGFFDETNFYGMFYDQTIPSGIDISNWDISHVTSLESMFSLAKIPEGFDINNWDVSNVTNMYAVFASSVISSDLDISNWDISSVTNLSGLFYNAQIPSGLDMSNWNTSSVTNMASMFTKITIPEGFDISNWDTSNVTTMQNMFGETYIPYGFDISVWDTSSLTNLYATFYSSQLPVGFNTSILNNWNMSKVVTTQFMFDGVHYY